jgi:hypothetical protein
LQFSLVVRLDAGSAQISTRRCGVYHDQPTNISRLATGDGCYVAPMLSIHT